MKDSKFIELLNLYVDHQISAADAALLEAEIQTKPQRRQVYRQYCQMQKACTMLAENFRTEAPAGSKAVQFAPRRRAFAPFAYSIGAIAAAACLTFVMVNRSHLTSASVANNDHTPSPTAQVAPQSMAAEPAATPVLLPERVPLQPAFDGALRGAAQINFAASDSNRVPLAWIKSVQLKGVPADELRFESRATLQPQELMFRNSPRTFQGQTELTAWRFMK